MPHEMGHVATMQPNIESTLAPTAQPVAVTKHGIAAVREISLEASSGLSEM